MNALEFRKVIEWEGRLAAARKAIRPDIDSEEQAIALIKSYIQSLLYARKYAAAGILRWGENLFTLHPECTKMVWRAISAHSKVLVMGGSSVGKSFTGIAWNSLNWEADPEYTTVKLISTNGGHAKANTFSTLKMLHKESVVPSTGVIRAEAIQFKEGDDRGCVNIVRIKEGDDNSGSLQGFHPLPRPTAHQIFGSHSRVVGVFDEAEEIPNGAWTGADNMTATISEGDENVKIMGFFNPKDNSSKVAQLAEPEGGWGEFDVETGVRGKDIWKSRAGYTVVRVDPAKTENVKQRKLVFTGFHTYEKHREYQSQDGGNSLHYYTFGRGAYPPSGVVCTVIPQEIINKMRGDFVFQGTVSKCASLDTALNGGDDAVVTVGRTGLAIALKRRVIVGGNKSIELIRFRKPRRVLQLDQQFILRKGLTEAIAGQFRDSCKSLKVAPEWTMIDSTGNGAGVYGLLTSESYWSPKVGQLLFSAKATDLKVIEEDNFIASEKYDGIDSECWFAFRRWAEFGYVAISAGMNSEELERQLAGRRQKLGAGELQKIEDKDIYKRRLGRSPDHADSAVILLHRVRTMEESSVEMDDQEKPERRDAHHEEESIDWLADTSV